MCTYYTETIQTHILSLSMLLLLLQDYTCCSYNSASHELRRIALCFSALLENVCTVLFFRQFFGISKQILAEILSLVEILPELYNKFAELCQYFAKLGQICYVFA